MGDLVTSQWSVSKLVSLAQLLRKGAKEDTAYFKYNILTPVL